MLTGKKDEDLRVYHVFFFMYLFLMEHFQYFTIKFDVDTCLNHIGEVTYSSFTFSLLFFLIYFLLVFNLLAYRITPSARHPFTPTPRLFDF